jgi:hypothetical protein
VVPKDFAFSCNKSQAMSILGTNSAEILKDLFVCLFDCK